jgi:hypothetical protein
MLLNKKTREGGLHEGHASLVYLDSIGCNSVGSIDQHLYCFLERQNQHCIDRVMTEHRSVYEGFSGGTSRDWFRSVFIDRTAFGTA